VDNLVRDAKAGDVTALRLLWRIHGVRLPLVEREHGVTMDGVARFGQPFDRDNTLDTIPSAKERSDDK